MCTSLMRSPTDLLTATFDLVAEGMTLNTLLPKRRYTTTSGFSKYPKKINYVYAAICDSRCCD